MKYPFLIGLLLAGLCLRVSAQTFPPCGVNDARLPDSTVRMMGQLPRLLASQNARKLANERRVCRVAVEIDSDTYLEFERDTNRIRSYVLDQMERVSKIYEREINTQLSVVYIHVWKDTEPDPYRGELNMFTLYTRFTATWSSQFSRVAADKRYYMITKNAYGAGGLGALPGGYAVGFVTTNIIAHELGHNFGSPHTQSCNWPGGPIDFCSTSEGECYKGSLQSTVGTVMSYCGYTDNTFHPLSQALMVDHAAKNLALLTAPGTAPSLPTQVTLNGTPFLYWNGVPVAERYDVEVATDAGFTQKVISDTTQINGYELSRLTQDQPYYVRIRAVNKLGSSAWSVLSQIKRVGTDGIIAPVLVTPTANQRMLPYNRGVRQFSVQPVSGATSYEIQLTSLTDDRFNYPLLKLTQPTASFTATAGQMGTVRWRARALVGTKTGPWSAVGQYSVNPEPYYISLPFYSGDVAPLSFPCAYFQTTTQSSVQLTLATDSSFASPVYTRDLPTAVNSTVLLSMLDNLSPNTQYYVRVEERDSQVPGVPAGVLTRTVVSFKTGTSALPVGWKLINNVTKQNWPQGGTYGALTIADNALWYSSLNGLMRVSEDSLVLRTYTAGNTSGKLGNVGALLSSDAGQAVWFTNRTSTNVFRNGFAVPYYQIGKLNSQTGALTESAAYNTSYSVSSFRSSPRLFTAYNAIYEPRADSLSRIYTLPANRSISQTLIDKTGLVWMIQYNSLASQYELVQFNALTKTTRTFSADNTTQLGRYLNYMALDALGNLWVGQSSSTYPFPPLARYDGQSWTAYNQGAAMPISYVINMTSDPLGNLFVIDNSLPRSLYKYDGISWKKLATMPLYTNMGTMSADVQGNVWFNGAMQVVGYTACANAPSPTLNSARQTIEIGETTTLQAVGCTDVLWSWSSETETVSNRLIRGTNQLVVKPEATTVYRSRCYTTNCSGEEVSVTLTVLPKLTLTRSTKASYCTGDSLTVGYSLQGKVGSTNQYLFVYNLVGQTNSLPATVRGATLSAVLPTTLAPGRYVFYLEASQPAVRARDSIQLTVSARPTAEISSDKLTFTLGDSARISVAFTGQSPWQFTRWDSQLVRTSTSPYVATLRATLPTNYTLSVTNLSDANCTGTVAKNGLVVSALALGNEPLLADGIRVYPNPTADRLVVDLKPGLPLPTSIQLRDEQGREVRRKAAGLNRREEWDLRSLPAGSYILYVETQDGRSANWKIVKQ